MTSAFCMMTLNQFGLKSKTEEENFLCGCVYRHQNTDVENFLGYIKSTLSKFDKNKYHVFLMGDFNIDLLQYESHSHTNDFRNSMISNSLLPYIHQPTRVIEHSATVTDNIFSDITDHETLSGNITSSIADHFAQFLSIFTPNLEIVSSQNNVKVKLNIIRII